MEFKKLETELEKIYERLLNNESIADSIATSVHPQYKSSAKNLYRYLLLRSLDIREIQSDLSEIGISSLGSGAGYVYENISNALKLVKLLNGKTWEKNSSLEAIGYSGSKELLVKHANDLFKTDSGERETEIMVTMPDEVTKNKKLIKKLRLAGMGISRLNLSHGNEKLWKKILKNIKSLKHELNLPINVYMDLPGPKIRISNIYIGVDSEKPLNSVPFLKIHKGTKLLLIKPNSRYILEGNDKITHPLDIALIEVSLPQIIDDLKVGQSVFFDDGAIYAKVKSISDNSASLDIKRTHKKKLRPGKGINLPDTHLNLPSLTPEDLQLLPFISANADLIGYSFVRNAEDVSQLYEELDKLGNNDIGVVFKIENRTAFENLPSILFRAMKRPKIGVMIARGDLAVELGFERISEVQNEILWLCEAAQIPVIWATQVLDTMAKKGMATRAEISDATISAQAECVMLNKGPFIVEATKTLKNVLIRMEAHSQKTKKTLRALKVAKKGLKDIHKEFQ
ncbi:pyruvate kinase [Arenibacter sp. BSSL-BM3]|uniref:Pyruvate kinase n=1 Tax=Arenibacter arenosicollis TaxID=2762274 RepID=A0ABR7QIR1_9FLAO|nr:pyruvate kinase [Arenibacter arenosicollis]MBC8767081.1 pyruvate kinase [Arenibacter arenosicollis]